MNETYSSRKQVENSYKDLKNSLENFSDSLERIEGVNDVFDNIQKHFTNILYEKINVAQKELSSSHEETVWDNLVIAFFGETNAGKSTIIETFRILFDDKREKEDGLIVGYGRHDFTKVYEEYQLSIEGHPFTLIDVPGIEGEESKYKDEISKALHKAHCVFYVLKEKPSTATASKIKQYLGDWVKVYSIFNVRGGASDYDKEEEREFLLTTNDRKKEILIKETFEQILGNVYSGNITIQALLAMCAKAVFSPKREDLANTQRKLLMYFGTPEKILQFSQFQTIINIVNEKSQNFTSEIVEANKQKMISLANSVKADLDKVIEEQTEDITKLKEHLRSFRNNSANIISTTKKNLKNKTRGKLDNNYARLKTRIYEIIDDDSIEDKKKFIANEQENIKIFLRNDINQIVCQELENAKSKLNSKRKELKGIALYEINKPYFHVNFANIDFDGALEELDVSFEDFLDWAAKTLSTALAGVPFGPIGIAAAAGFGGLIHLFTGKDGKSEAKNQVSQAIEEDKERAWNKMSYSMSKVHRELDKQSHSIRNAVDRELNSIERMMAVVNRTQFHLQEFANNIKHSGYGTI